MDNIFLSEDLVDLHIHTTASDGSWTPEMLIDKAKAANIKMISVTDHDSVQNVDKANLLAIEAGIKFVTGVEITSSFNGQIYHILGYGVDIKDKTLEDLLHKNRIMLDEEDDNSIKLLIKAGYPITFRQYLDYENDQSRGGWKALNFLIDSKICIDMKDFFSRLFTGDLAFPFSNFPSPEHVINVIRNSGGIAIIAHPGDPYNRLSIKETLEQFSCFGIQGIECFHPNHNSEVTKFCLDWCKKNNMMISGGSDSHGDFSKTRQLGIPNVFINQINLGNLTEYTNV